MTTGRETAGTAAPGRRLPGLAALVGGALLGLTLGAGTVWATPGDNPAGPEIGTLKGDIETLRLQIQGMEDKLRESAAARKSADQARMEADRRLAEALQENDRLEAESALLREAKQAIEASLRRNQERTAELTETLAKAEERARRLAAERETDALRSASLERRLKDNETETARLAAELEALRAERDVLASRVSDLEALVPAQDGGTLTPEAARAEATAAATGLRQAYQAIDGPRDSAGRRAVTEAEQALHRRQLALARAAGAAGVYRVRPNDSLALIANRFYGESGRWSEILKANRHILSDPDRLMPGTTLVIP